MDPALRAEVNALHDLALERLGELAQDMRMEEYTGLGILLGVCVTLRQPGQHRWQ